MKNILVFLSILIISQFSFADGQASVKDDVSQKNIVQIAIGSKDHSTLITALKAADLVDVMANPGPFTVFAPVNTAFDKLPKGTVETLLKPESKDALTDVLHHHVFVGVLELKDLTDGRTLNQVDGNNVTIKKVGSKITVDGANIIATVRASNGIIHIVDSVILVKK